MCRKQRSRALWHWPGAKFWLLLLFLSYKPWSTDSKSKRTKLQTITSNSQISAQQRKHPAVWRFKLWSHLQTIHLIWHKYPKSIWNWINLLHITEKRYTVFNVQQDLNRHFSKADTERSSKCMNTNVTKETQMKTAMKNHPTAVRLAVSRMTKENKCW